MSFSALRALVGTALALGAVAVSPQHAAAQAPLTGVEQARIDSVRRPYTVADIEFMKGMIAHHSQAVKMAGWAKSHGASPSLQIYAGRVALGQSSEIGLMQDWLRDRNQQVPEADTSGTAMNMAGMAGMSGMSGMSGMGSSTLMPGMLTPAQMAQLDSARGVNFDRLFLTDMIQHHKGAIKMVSDLFATPGAAQDEFTFKFANDVQADQTTEIDRMQQMLAALPPG